jgi:hypothetical protein
MKKHTVKRTWIRADGTVVTKEYTYGRGKSRRGKVLVNAKGIVNKKNLADFKLEIQNSTIGAAEKRTLLADLDARIRERKRNKKKLTTTGFAGLQQEQNIERMFANAGYSISEAATEFELTEAELLNPDNWEGNIYTEKGVQYSFAFSYTGALFSRI